jgi:hypothetical protein
MLNYFNFFQNFKIAYFIFSPNLGRYTPNYFFFNIVTLFYAVTPNSSHWCITYYVYLPALQYLFGTTSYFYLRPCFSYLFYIKSTCTRSQQEMEYWRGNMNEERPVRERQVACHDIFVIVISLCPYKDERLRENDF